MQTRWQQLKRAVRYNYLRIMRQGLSTHCIASGMAAGIFAGCLPILPFQTVVALGLAFIFRGSKIAAMAGTWISNPLNWVPVYTLTYYIGRAVTPFDVSFDPQHLEIKQMLAQGWELVVLMLAGGVVIAIPTTFIAYIVTFRAVNRFRQRRMIRLIKKYRDGASS